ncbi:hypothetical protein PMY56_12470 [Clostridium tertium]|uniref:hypothetical protein n=1 Tax=Clostridium TaxID=1485 RepID=UPI001D571FE4|nr:MULTISPECIES: hypothetical protein [Clostridium]MBS5308515.1 hypothetical protein [Clostridium sp.]MDB1923828.1 hypothetical protein [Clostridium tertium]MDB1926948.1 hypothetical protein [Clostridium tertium]MDB1930668.1 hypothetical protein [Clostridium tertium]MDB1934276.1 hypothetical protein [Clostridium tertium]
MENKDLLKLLNSIDYSDNEIIELENISLEKENTIGEDLYKIKNDKVLKKIAFLELENLVISKLSKDDKIKYKIIALQSYFEKDVHRVWAGAMGGDPTIYLGIFITNYRIFIYKMGRTYNLLEEGYSDEIENIECLIDMWNQCETISIKFKDGKEFSPRPFGDKTQQLFLDIIKYLKDEKSIKIIECQKKKLSSFEKILLFLLYLLIVIIPLSLIF